MRIAAAPAERFRALLDDDAVIDHPLGRGLYARDGSVVEGDCGLVVMPESAEQVAACIRLAGELGMAIVPRGSGTGLAGGAVPLAGGLVVSVGPVRRILEIDARAPRARVEPRGPKPHADPPLRPPRLHSPPGP